MTKTEKQVAEEIKKLVEDNGMVFVVTSVKHETWGSTIGHNILIKKVNGDRYDRGVLLQEV